MSRKRSAIKCLRGASHETSSGKCQRGFFRCRIERPLRMLAAVFFFGVAGCIIIPTPEHTLLTGRGEIGESDIAFMSVGDTTREEALLRFGEPDLVLRDQRILIYHWSVSHGYWLVAGGYQAAGGPIPKKYLFMLEFDGEGRLSRFEMGGSLLASAEKRIDEWTPPESEKLSGMHRQNIIIDPMPATFLQTSFIDTESIPSRFTVGEFRDGRTGPSTGNFIGQKMAAFGVIVSDVRTCKPPADVVQAAVVQQLQGMGHRLVVNDADVAVNGKIVEFGVTTSVGLSSWDAVGTLDVILEVARATEPVAKISCRYVANKVAKTLLGPSDENFEQVMRECLEDMQKQMASDETLARLLGWDHGKD